RRKRLDELLPADALADDYGRTVAATFSLSVEQANRIVPVGLAEPVLRLASVLDPNGVPIEVLTSPAAQAYLAAHSDQSPSGATPAPGPDQPASGSEMTAEDCADAVACLHRLSLVSYDPGSPVRAIRTHAMVQRATLDHLPPPALAELVRAAADGLAKVWPDI